MKPSLLCYCGVESSGWQTVNFKHEIFVRTLQGGTRQTACNAPVNSTDLLYKHSINLTQSDIRVGVSVEVGDALLVLNLVIFLPAFSPQRQCGVVLDSFAVGFLRNILPHLLRHQIRETTENTGAFVTFVFNSLAVDFILDIAHLNVQVQTVTERIVYTVTLPHLVDEFGEVLLVHALDQIVDDQPVRVGGVSQELFYLPLVFR